MNWRQVLAKLDNDLLKWFNKRVTEEAQRQVNWYKLRCWNCEAVLDVSADSEYGAVQSALSYFDWTYFAVKICPGYEQWKYLCEKCKENNGV